MRVLTIDPNKRVHVYRNLHNGLWSIRQDGIIVGHDDHLLLKDCKFRVQPAGRAKVLAERKKNVHAYISGFLCNQEDTNIVPEGNSCEVSYNPYKHPYFYNVETGEAIYECDFVDMESGDTLLPVLALFKGPSNANVANTIHA